MSTHSCTVWVNSYPKDSDKTKREIKEYGVTKNKTVVLTTTTTTPLMTDDVVTMTIENEK